MVVDASNRHYSSLKVHWLGSIWAYSWPTLTFLLMLFLYPDYLLGGFVFPSLAYVVLYFWSFYYPHRLAWALFTTGCVFYDVWIGEAWGTSFFIFVLFVGGVLLIKRFILLVPFTVAWMGFSVYMTIFSIMIKLSPLHYVDAYRWVDILFSLIWLILLYPLVAGVLFFFASPRHTSS
jgi:hypothetical protein